MPDKIPKRECYQTVTPLLLARVKDSTTVQGPGPKTGSRELSQHCNNTTVCQNIHGGNKPQADGQSHGAKVTCPNISGIQSTSQYYRIGTNIADVDIT